MRRTGFSCAMATPRASPIDQSVRSATTDLPYAPVGGVGMDHRSERIIRRTFFRWEAFECSRLNRDFACPLLFLMFFHRPEHVKTTWCRTGNAVDWGIGRGEPG